MFSLFPLLFISCPKPNRSPSDSSIQKHLEWTISVGDFISLDITSETTQGSQKGIMSYWKKEDVDIIANTPCSSTVLATIQSSSGKELQRLEQAPNSFGEISFTFPVHRTKRELTIALQCETEVEKDWQVRHPIVRNQDPLPQLYSPAQWNAKAENSICFLDAVQGYIEVDYRRLGEREDSEGFHIGVGEQGEWQTLMRTHIYKPLECIALKPTETFSTPLEMRLRLRKDGLERELRRIVTPKPSLWVSAPKTLEQGKEGTLLIRVDNPSGFSLIDLQIIGGKTELHHKVPLSKEGLITIPFLPNSTGFHQIIASFGKVKTQASFWVEPKQQSFVLSSSAKLPKKDENFHQLLLSSHKLPEYDEHATPFPPTTRVHVPSFLRLGDQAKQVILHWDEAITETTELLPEAHFEDDFPIPILLSPSDNISLQLGTERLYDQSSTQEFSLPISAQPYYLTTDARFSTPLISNLLSDLLAPHHPKTDAHFLQRAAVAWDSLATQQAPWFTLILERAKENIEWLELWHSKNGWADPETNLLVIQSLIEAHHAGLTPKTSFFFEGIEYLCSGGESPRWAHLRWKLEQSQLDLFSCEEIAEPMWARQEISHPQTREEWEIFLLQRAHSKTSLTEMTDRLAPFYQNIPDDPWLEFAIWNWEKYRYQSYHNLRMSVTSSQELIHKGLFHTWQRKNIFARFEILPETPPITFQVDGIGSLHWGLWQFIPQQRAPSAQERLSISRRLLHFDQQEVSLSALELGETLFLEHHIEGEPNQSLLLSIFPPANLIIFGKELSQGIIRKEITLDQTGQVTLQMPVLNTLSGSFQFPASQIQKNDMIAHSGDWIIQSQ